MTAPEAGPRTCVVAVDAGTTGVRALAIDDAGQHGYHRDAPTTHLR